MYCTIHKQEKNEQTEQTKNSNSKQTVKKKQHMIFNINFVIYLNCLKIQAITNECKHNLKRRHGEERFIALHSAVNWCIDRSLCDKSTKVGTNDC